MAKGKVEFCQAAGYARMANARWSWGAANDAGDILLLVWADESERIGKGLERVWVYGDHSSDTDPGGIERREHLDRISRGARAVVAFCSCSDHSEERAHEKIDDIRPTLWPVVKVEAPDERGRVHLIVRHPELPSSAWGSLTPGDDPQRLRGGSLPDG